jgi:hypothetical protein
MQNENVPMRFPILLLIMTTINFVQCKECQFNPTTKGVCISKENCLSDVWAYGSVEHPICEESGQEWTNPTVKVCCNEQALQN